MHRSCPECLAPYNDRVLRRREVLLCDRCGKELKKYADPLLLQAAWALITAALIFLFLANTTPIMIFDVSGNRQSSFIITGVTSLFAQGYWPLALLVFIFAIVLPTLHLSTFWYLLAGCCANQVFPTRSSCTFSWSNSSSWPGIKTVARLVELLDGWNIIPVFAVATIVAVMKLDQLGTIEWQVGALWIVLVALCSMLATIFVDSTVISSFLVDQDALA